MAFSDRLRRGLVKRLIRHGVFEPMAHVFAAASYPNSELPLPRTVVPRERAADVLEAELRRPQRAGCEESLATELFAMSARQLAMSVYGLESDSWFSTPQDAPETSAPRLSPASPAEAPSGASPSFAQSVATGLHAILDEGSNPVVVDLPGLGESVLVRILDEEFMNFAFADEELLFVTATGGITRARTVSVWQGTGFNFVQDEPVSACLAVADAVIRRLVEVSADESMPLSVRATCESEADRARVVALYMLLSLEEGDAAPEVQDKIRTAVDRLGDVRRSLIGD